MPLNLASSGGGSVTLQADSTASAFTQTIPAVSGTNGPIVAGTSQATTSGTSITFTGIPSWAKRITVNFVGVSQSGTTQMEVRLGTSGGVVSTGYVSGASSGLNAVGSTSSTTGFRIRNSTASDDIHGCMFITNQTGNTWTCSYSMGASNGAFFIGGGSITLGAALDRVLIAPNSADTFDAGSINILYE